MDHRDPATRLPRKPQVKRRRKDNSRDLPALHRRGIVLSLAVSNNHAVKTKQGVKAVGKLDGVGRRPQVFSAKRSRIATQGALSRYLSLHAAERVERNFAYLETIRVLRQAGRALRAG